MFEAMIMLCDLGVEVPMSATVAELKLALEEFFNLLPKDERCTISW